MRTQLGHLGRQLERALIGRFPEDIRYNLRIDTSAAIIFGIFYAAAISFMPVVLRRLGASSDLLALYTAQTYLGSVLATLGVLLMRRFSPMAFGAICWLIGRSLLLLIFWITDAAWLLALTAVFWTLEALPAPAYARIVQAIYPLRYRGRALALVRVGMVLALLITTPLAGIGFDTLGYQILIPLASVLGVIATLLFTRLRIAPDALPPQPARSLGSIWGILGQNRSFAIYLLSFSLYGLGFLMCLPLFPIVQVDRLGLSYSQIGYLGLAQSVFWLLGNLYWGRQIDRRGGMWVMRANFVVALIVPFCYIWAVNGWMLLPAFIAHGIIAAGIDLAVISTAMELADPEQVAEYSALQATIIGLRGMLGPFIGVALLRLGLPDYVVFAIGCVFIGLGWLCLGLATRQRPSARQRALHAPVGDEPDQRDKHIQREGDPGVDERQRHGGEVDDQRDQALAILAQRDGER